MIGSRWSALTSTRFGLVVSTKYSMTPIRLPGSGLTVSSLCLGGTMHGNTITEAEIFALLDRFVALGGNFLDAARIYFDWVPGESSGWKPGLAP